MSTTCAWFKNYRTDIFTPAADTSQEPRIEELTVDEIMNGVPGSNYRVATLYSLTIVRKKNVLSYIF
jgi:hypothetical protein